MGNVHSTIVLDFPNQPFYSGSSVTGSVLIDVKKVKNYKRISIHFLGRAHVQWTERRDGGGGPAGGVCTIDYISSEDFVDVEQTLWTTDQSPDGHLHPGQYNFPFCFDIPPNAPSSFEGTVGSIRYTLYGRIVTGPLNFDKRMEATIPVQQMVRISDPCLLQPVCQRVQKAVCHLCCVSAPIVLTVTIPKTGYYIGETIPVCVSVENGSGHCITLKASLHQSVMYTAQGQYRYSTACFMSIKSDKIAPQTTCEWNPSFLVPATDVFNNFSCSNIKVSYYLKITTANTFLVPKLSTEILLNFGCVCNQPPLGWNTLSLQSFPGVHLPPPYPHERPPPYSQTNSATPIH